MLIDTGKRTVKLQITKQLLAIIIIILLAVVHLSPLRYWLDGHGISRPYIYLALPLLYILWYVSLILRDYGYVYISDTIVPGRLLIRHYRIRPLNSRKEEFQIPLSELDSYRFVREGMGRRYLLLRQGRGGQVFVYPRVSIVMLSGQERDILETTLEKYAKRKDSTQPTD
ncbi:MAG: hypothetical protein CSA07_00270 [Bacteroidia bacterium]|nr:MAG: hypothetical protein CSA07_00270 [Bacteroidia bacterium]